MFNAWALPHSTLNIHHSTFLVSSLRPSSHFFFDDDFFDDERFFEVDFFDFFFAGTFPPARRASERPMAMACLRLVTFLPERPLLSVPLLRSCIAFSTLLCAFFPYFAAIATPFAARSCKLQ